MFLTSKRLFITALSLALAFTLSGFARVAHSAGDEAPEKVVIATVDGMEITRSDVENRVNQLLPMQSFHSFVSERRLEAFQRQAINELIDEELIYKAALKTDIKVTKKAIEDEIEKIEKKIPEGQTLKEVLKRSNMTAKDLRDDLRRGLIIKEMKALKNDEFKKKAQERVTDEFVHEYYKKNMEKFRMPEKVHLRSMLFKADPAGGQRVWNEARRKAMDIAERVRKGEDFAELAKKHSEDPMAEKGGDMGWAHKGSLFDEIEMAVSNLEVGETSDPVMTIYGYHVVKVEEREPPVQMKFSEINQEKLKGELRAKEHSRLKKAWTASLRDNAKVEHLRELY